MNELAPLESFASGLLARLAPAERRKLARTLASSLRESQSRRVGAQLNPDGTPYAPRKPRLRRKPGSLRRRTMFSKLRTARWMKAESSPDAAVVTFAAQVQAMAKVHQHGLRDRVNRRGGPEVDYPARQLLGLTDPEIAAVEDAVLAYLAG
ncbi:MAG: phage virion morphogenesis protein [Denitratisoma sp.]|nr:phage virion morphogenesis protein [Denitratisoma sp.]